MKFPSAIINFSSAKPKVVQEEYVAKQMFNPTQFDLIEGLHFNGWLSVTAFSTLCLYHLVLTNDD
jgi:hypothetical protein